MTDVAQLLERDYFDGTLATAIEVLAGKSTDFVEAAELGEAAAKIRWSVTEIEALRDELREARHERDGFHAERDLAREDVARLREQAAEIERRRLTIIKLQGHQAALEAEISHLRKQIEDEREDAAKAMKEAAAREAMTDRTIEAHGAHCRCTTCELNIVEGDIRCIPTGQFRRRIDAA